MDVIKQAAKHVNDKAHFKNNSPFVYAHPADKIGNELLYIIELQFHQGVMGCMINKGKFNLPVKFIGKEMDWKFEDTGNWVNSKLLRERLYSIWTGLTYRHLKTK